MKKSVKTAWIKALRSGKYKQGPGQLREGNNFCCLGVLCDLYSKKKGVKWEKSIDNTMQIDGATGVLPFNVMNWAGLSSSNPIINGNSLSHHNDFQNKDFKEIADLIDENILGI